MRRVIRETITIETVIQWGQTATDDTRAIGSEREISVDENTPYAIAKKNCANQQILVIIQTYTFFYTLGNGN